ncbi:MAG: OmpA family protein, partial [Bacteroidales bacterium]|nr:OmpA family protein [Bacteroidales bacterium]
ALKAYLDQERVLNIPNVRFNPTGIGVSSHNSDGKTPGYIKNIRLAKGAVPLYDKWLTEGRFSTTGIKFDVNKSTLKNESMGTINYVAEMMKKHSELSFIIEGHTDSDGQDDFNQKLSEQRANTVKNTLVELGIDASRLTCAGYGESRPVSDNTTPEGKAANRRVEFVKQ